jgi:phosphopantetheinyl transferase (holo-ACP synthase)
VLVGNDIVDLDDPDNLRAPRHPRFAVRVLTEHERVLAASSTDPYALAWSLFAAKEAAYKLLVKLGESPGFGYRRLQVAPDLKSVRFAEHLLGLELTRAAGSIHAIAMLGAEAPRASAVEPVVSGATPSAAARALAVRLASSLVDAPAFELEVVRAEAPGSWDGFAPPRLLLRGEILPVDVSLSHDGRWVAACVSRDVEGRRRVSATACVESSLARVRRSLPRCCETG